MLRGVAQRLLGAPLRVKILGIGLIVTLLFGAVTFYSVRRSLHETHDTLHAETVLSLARMLTTSMEPHLRAGDTEGAARHIDTLVETFPDVRFVVVQAPGGAVQAHRFTFNSAMPPDLHHRGAELCGTCHAMSYPVELDPVALELASEQPLEEATFRSYERHGGRVLEISAPLLDGAAGTLRIGIGDRTLVRESEALTRAVVLSLVLCLVVGLGLALVLASFLVRPIRELVGVTHSLRAGDFSARARVHAHDEVGTLAQAVNLMAEELQTYQARVSEKERSHQALLDRLVLAQEDERKSVARELHDQLGQSLSTVLLSVQNLCRDCHLGESRYAGIERELRGLIDEVRQLAWDIRPSLLDDYGLDSALERYVQEVSQRTQLPIDFHCVYPADAPRLPSRIEVTLYRVAQEAITNILRHAAAPSASVVLVRRDGHATLLVEDAGCGFDVGHVEQGGDRNALGLLGMRERVALIGGELRIESEPGHGTQIQIKVPIAETA